MKKQYAVCFQDLIVEANNEEEAEELGKKGIKNKEVQIDYVVNLED